MVGVYMYVCMFQFVLHKKCISPVQDLGCGAGWLSEAKEAKERQPGSRCELWMMIY